MKLPTRSSKVSHTIRSSKVRRLQAWLHLEWYDDLAWASKRYEWEGNGGCMDCGIGVQGDVIQQSCPVPHLKTEILRHCISKVLFSKIMELLFKDLLDLGYRHCHEDERCGCLAQCVSWVLTSGKFRKQIKRFQIMGRFNFKLTTNPAATPGTVGQKVWVLIWHGEEVGIHTIYSHLNLTKKFGYFWKVGQSLLICFGHLSRLGINMVHSSWLTSGVIG